MHTEGKHFTFYSNEFLEAAFLSLKEVGSASSIMENSIETLTFQLIGKLSLKIAQK